MDLFVKAIHLKIIKETSRSGTNQNCLCETDSVHYLREAAILHVFLLYTSFTEISATLSESALSSPREHSIIYPNGIWILENCWSCMICHFVGSMRIDQNLPSHKSQTLGLKSPQPYEMHLLHISISLIAIHTVLQA